MTFTQKKKENLFKKNLFKLNLKKTCTFQQVGYHARKLKLKKKLNVNT